MSASITETDRFHKQQVSSLDKETEPDSLETSSQELQQSQTTSDQPPSSPTPSTSSSNFHSPQAEFYASPILTGLPDPSSYSQLPLNSISPSSPYSVSTKMERPHAENLNSPKTDIATSTAHVNFQTLINSNEPPNVSTDIQHTQSEKSFDMSGKIATGEAITPLFDNSSTFPTSVSSPNPRSVISPISSIRRAQSLKSSTESLKPSLPIVGSTELSEDISTPSATSQKPSNPASPQLDSSTRQSSLPSLTAGNLEAQVSQSPPIPPRAAKHSHTSSTSSVVKSQKHPNILRPAPLHVESLGNGEDIPNNFAYPGKSESSAFDGSQNDSLIPNLDRYSSAPSTPISSDTLGTAQKSQEMLSQLKPPNTIITPGPLVNNAQTPSITNFSLEQATFSELKSLLSEKLIQLSQVQSQNAQLWALVNKQRTMIFDLQKDLDGAVEQNEKYRAMLTKHHTNSFPSTSSLTSTTSVSTSNKHSKGSSKDKLHSPSGSQANLAKKHDSHTSKLKRGPLVENPPSQNSQKSLISSPKSSSEPSDERELELPQKDSDKKSSTEVSENGALKSRPPPISLPETSNNIDPNSSAATFSSSINGSNPIEPMTPANNGPLSAVSRSTFDFSDTPPQRSHTSDSIATTERDQGSIHKSDAETDVVLFVKPEEISTIWLDISTLIGKVKSAYKKREDPVAIINMLDRESKKELWKVIKDYTSLVSLDAVLRPLLTQYNIPKLPERLLFQSHAPSRVDARKVALEDYFFGILRLSNLPPAAALALCKFLSTDMIDPMDIPDTPSRREGYLTKRGKKIRGWKVRYFVIEADNLNYYDKPGGDLQGSICLAGAKIGCQTKNDAENNSSDEPIEKAFRHAFLLVEPKKKDYVRHVLCAESDEDRDMWISALMDVISQVTISSLVPPNISSDPGSPKKAIPSSSFSPTSEALHLKENSTRVSMIPPPLPQHQSHPSINSLVSPTSSNWKKSASLGELNTSVNDLRPIGSMEEDEESPTKEVKKQKKKGFFSSFRSRNNNNNNHTPSLPPAQPVPETIDQFQSTPYSAVEEKNLPSTKCNAPSFATKNDDSSLHALGISLEEAISSQQEGAPSTASESSLLKQSNSHTSGDKSPIRRVFGVPLPEAISLASKTVHHCVVPAIVYRCIELLKVRDAIFEEGIFRLSGSTATIRSLKERFNMEYDVDLVNSETYYDIHAVSGLLKLYLREIPTLILSSYLAPEFREAVDIEDPTTKILKLKSLVQELPRENRDLLCVICSLLTEIIGHSNINKMNLRNVGIVFAPTLNISAYVLIHFLTDFDAIFGDETDDEDHTHEQETQLLSEDTADEIEQDDEDMTVENKMASENQAKTSTSSQPGETNTVGQTE